MIANITILENGSYSPSQEIFFGNKYDNLKNNYLVLTIPNEYRNYYHYMYGQCGKANILLPCNYVDGELRFYITSSITKTPGRWEMVFIAAQEALDINSSLSANQIIFGAQRFISSTFIGIVQDNNLTNPPLTDLDDENLIIYYERLNQLEKDLNNAWKEGKLDGPYYIPTVEDGTHGEALLTWEGSREGMPEVATVDIRGKQGKQGPYYIPSEENGILSWTGTQTGMEEVESTNIKEWVENASETYLDIKLPEEVNTAVDEKFKYVWDEETQTLYISARENDSESDSLPPSQVEQILNKVKTLEEGLETIPERAVKIVDKLPETNIESNVIYGVKKEKENYNYHIYNGEKWIELGKGGIPSISLSIPNIGPDYEYPIIDKDLETIINNDVVIANVSFDTGEDGFELSCKLFKTSSVKIGDNNEIVMSTITNNIGSATPTPVYLKLIVNLTTKTYMIDFKTFASDIKNSNNTIYLEDGSGTRTGSSIYISTINGENIVGRNDGNTTTSIKLTNITVNTWTSDNTYADYRYRATITESTITSSMVAEVIYGLTEAESGNYAPVCETFNGGVYIYSKVNTSIIIPTILVVK